MSGSSLAVRPVTDIAGELPSIFALAKSLVTAGGFLPAHLRGEGEIVAVVLAGRELGIGPMASIRSIKLVKGNVTLDAALQLGLMIRAGAKFRWIADGSDGKTASIELSRDGQEPYVSTFKIEFAERAGLLKDGGNWKMYPQAMLRARAISAAGKAYMPDVMAGIYLPEELDGEYEAPRSEPAQEWIETTATAFPAAVEPPPRHPRMDAIMGALLPTATNLVQFVDVARSLLECHGRDWSSPEWVAFAAACASHEVAPREAIKLGMQPLHAEAAQ